MLICYFTYVICCLFIQTFVDLLLFMSLGAAVLMTRSHCKLYEHLGSVVHVVPWEQVEGYTVAMFFGDNFSPFLFFVTSVLAKVVLLC
jgi:hypothetical protein